MASTLQQRHACRRPFTASNGINTRHAIVSRTRLHAARQQCTEQQAGSLVDSTAADAGLSRRQFMQAAAGLLAAAGLVAPVQPALALLDTPDGYQARVDKLDGYTFVYPDQWAPVTSSGNDIFVRNPFNVDQNLFVDITSPSSSRFASVEDLGSPDAAATRLLDKYLNKEFMSTRIGIRREGEIISAASRQGSDGRLYYDIEVRMASYGSRSPYVATNSEVMRDYGIEWDRRLLTTLGVANKRMYELRMQTSSDTYEQDKLVLDLIRNSFRTFEVEE